MQLSTNFTSKEFFCPCCKIAPMKEDFIAGLQLLREELGKRIYVLSGFRCVAYNASIGGATRSSHIYGEAADLYAEKTSLYKVYLAATKIAAFAYGGIGLYPQENFIHLDARGSRARWSRINGEYVGLELGVALLYNLERGS